MISIPAGGRVYLACGATDMRRGFDGLALIGSRRRDDIWLYTLTNIFEI
jgi:hypothetical protein